MAKVKIPKRVAGVKIPKKVRKKANKAIRMADSPLTRQIAAAALGATAGAKARDGEQDGERPRSRPLVVDADHLAEVVRAAAADGIRRFLEGFEEGLRDAAAALDEAVTPESGDAPVQRRDSNGPSDRGARD